MVSVAVVGAGIVGAMTAATLAERGADVTLIDEFDPLQQVSGAAFGSLTPFSDPFFTGALSQLAARGVALHRTWQQVLSQSTGLEVHSGPTGLIHLLTKAGDAEPKSVAVQQACQNESACRVATRKEVLKLEPNLRGNFSEAIIYDEPWIDLENLRASLSAFILSHAHIRFLKSRCVLLEEGKVARVHLATNEKLSFDHAIACTGLGVPPGALAGRLALSGVRGDVLLVQGAPEYLRHHVYRDNAFLTPRADGRILIGSTYVPEEHSFDRLPATNVIDTVVRGELLTGFSRVVEGADTFPMIREWRHWRPKLKNRGPAIGPIAEGSVLSVALGFIGLGVTLAPAVAELLSDIVLSGNNRIPVECRL